ncbi:hypothetical protein [Chryseobacterium sp. JV274]|uniref:hypothetical protein n=1 Tax=Chryseobacterium sp. JV274 TaxID=1932669 RepID=UPI0015C20DDB|nr:hypothetical protein [Chryseobacterium sp. JV274]CAD0220416.1 conserved protein of unknown function [Chryseobacterium sp. JV274]
MNLDYQIAEDYLLKLPSETREELCKKILSGLKTRKKTKKEIEHEYASYLSKSKSFKDFKEKYFTKK